MLNENNGNVLENDLLDLEEECKEKDIIRLEHVSVDQKIILCVDVTLNFRGSRRLSHILNSFLNCKNFTAVRNLEVDMLVFNNDSVHYYEKIDHNKKHIDDILCERSCREERGPVNLSEIFDAIARRVRLPDDVVYSLELPPPKVVHILFLFGRNMFTPTLKEPNSYYFLMDNPFLSLDIVYVCRRDVPKNRVDKIGQALQNILDHKKCYFFQVDRTKDSSEFLKALVRCSGHPLLRPSQKDANYDLHKTPQE